MQLDRCKPYERRHGDLEPWVIQGHHAFFGLGSLIARNDRDEPGRGAWRPPFWSTLKRCSTQYDTKAFKRARLLT